MTDKPLAAPASPLSYDNRISLQKLEVLCLVVELGGVTVAADHLWVAQSVVSGHLRSLQDRLGVQVLYRDGQQMKLTEAGERVYQWATETLSRTRDLMRDLHEVESGHLSIAASLAVGNYLLPPVLAAFRQEWPGSAITMSVSDPEETFALVEKGRCDLGIIIAETGHEHPHLRSEVIGHEEILLVTGPTSLPGVEAVSLTELASLALVAPSAGTVPREAVDRQLADLGSSPQNVVMELGHPEAMKRVIRSGIDACLLFRSCVEDDLKQGTLREIALTDTKLSLPVLSIEHTERPRRQIQDQLIEQTRAYLAARTT